MAYQRVPYADADPATTMHRDCGAVAGRLLPGRPLPMLDGRRTTAPLRVLSPGQARVGPELFVTDSAARFAASLHLHLS